MRFPPYRQSERKMDALLQLAGHAIKISEPESIHRSNSRIVTSPCVNLASVTQPPPHSVKHLYLITKPLHCTPHSRAAGISSGRYDHILISGQYLLVSFFFFFRDFHFVFLALSLPYNGWRGVVSIVRYTSSTHCPPIYCVIEIHQLL